MTPDRSVPAQQGSAYRLGFVCLGNICRSPMADVVMRHLVDEAGLSRAVDVTSCGTGPWHVGEPIDRRAGAELVAAGYDPSEHRGQQLDRSWLDRDLLLAMDADNLAGALELGGDPSRVRLFRSFDPTVRASQEVPDVPDPYYGGDEGFAAVLGMVERTCIALLTALERELALHQR